MKGELVVGEEVESFVWKVGGCVAVLRARAKVFNPKGRAVASGQKSNDGLARVAVTGIESEV